MGRLPEAQFLKYVRHAAAHGNRWHFEGGKPDKAASWRGFDLKRDPTVRRHPLEGQQCFGKCLFTGDLLTLLFDVQGSLPST